ncbi:MAG: hypothetical protein WA324_27840 [Bryobacteraceae bacterium]
MLGGERQVGLVNDLSYAPTLGQTFTAARAKTTEQVNLLAGYIAPGLTTENQRRKSADRLSTINELLNDPRQGFGQKSLNAVGDVIGSVIPTLPFLAAGGAIGAGVAGAIGFGAREIALDLGSETALSTYLSTQVPLSKLATTAASHYLPNASIGGIATGLAESYARYKGMIIPEHFAEHYDAVNNTLDSSHAIQDWASDNYGFLLGAAPMAAGYIAFKGLRGIIKHRNAIAESKAVDAELTRLLKQHDEVLKENQVKEGEHAAKVAKVSELQDHLQQAEEMGLISPEMHEWYLDYLEHPNDQGKVHEGGLKVLQSLQIPYDRVTGRVWNEVLTRDGVKNLQSSLFDQGITQFSEEENQLLSSYIIHNELDGYIGNMRDNPNLLNAIQGMTHNIGLKIAEHSAAMQKFESELTKNMGKGLRKKELFSQENIYEHLKKIGVYSKKQIPYEVPHSIIYKLSLERRLKKILSRETLEDEQMFQEGFHDEIKKELKELKLLTPQQELEKIKDSLFPKGKLKNNFKNNNEYYRLEELAQVWPNAQVLLDRIHMEATNAKQQGLNEILKKFTEMVDNNASRLADPDAVKRYLHSRIEQSVPFVREFEQSGIELSPTAKEVLKPEVLYDEISLEKVHASELKFAREEFEATEKKFKQFNENEKALEELIKCALGE